MRDQSPAAPRSRQPSRDRDPRAAPAALPSLQCPWRDYAAPASSSFPTIAQSRRARSDATGQSSPPATAAAPSSARVVRRCRRARRTPGTRALCARSRSARWRKYTVPGARAGSFPRSSHPGSANGWSVVVGGGGWWVVGGRWCKPITYHLPPTTYHPSPITHHPSPLTHHPSPITPYPSPITHHRVTSRSATSPTIWRLRALSLSIVS